MLDENSNSPARFACLSISISLTEFVHLYFEAFLVATGLTLIAPFLVNDTPTVSFARVDSISTDASHEEPATTVARIDTVVSSGRNISTYFAQDLGFSVFFHWR